MNRHENLQRTNFCKKTHLPLAHLPSKNLKEKSPESGVGRARGRVEYLVDGRDGCIDDLALEGFEYDGLILDGKLCETKAGDDFAGSNVDFMVIEDTDYVAVLAGTGAFDIREEFPFQVCAHIWAEEGWMQGQGQR